MTKYKIKPSEFCFLLAGVLIIASLPWIGGPGFNFWFAGKISYFIGLLFFIFKK